MDKNCCQKVWENGEDAIGGHELVRRMERKGKVLIWCCSKCSGYARQRMGPKLVSCCRPEQMGHRIWQNDEKNPRLLNKEESSQRGKELEN